MKKLTLILFLFGFLATSCDPDDPFEGGDCFIPEVAVNLTINMNLPEYFNLQNLGEFVSFENEGHRGVYVIHNYDDFFYAIERTCPYQSDNDCAQVTLDNDILQLRCGEFVSDTSFSECCASTYDFNSARLTGPTICNLKTYRVNRSGNVLYVSN